MPTSVYNLPFPSHSDSPDGPQQIEDLAQAVEDLMQSNHQIGGAIEVGGSLTVGGNLTLAGTLTVGGTVSFTSPAMQTLTVQNNTDIENFVNTGFESGDPICGLVKTVPPSGKLKVTVSGLIFQSQNTFRAVLSIRVGTGSTLGAGTELAGPSLVRCLSSSEAVNTGADALIMASYTRLVEGLTPGNTVNVVTQHAVTGGTGTVAQRELIVEPALG